MKGKIIYMGQFDDIYEGEAAIHSQYPQTKHFILRQVASAPTLRIAKQMAKGIAPKLNKYVIHATRRDAFFIYI